VVALHNKRLSEREIFRGVLWTDAEWHAQRDIIRARLEAEGEDSFRLSFAVSREMEKYQQTQPSMRERQQIMKRIYPPVRLPPSLALTNEERAWLIERLDGVNDPIGVDILAKLRAIDAKMGET